jgi:hypothetical protein
VITDAASATDVLTPADVPGLEVLSPGLDIGRAALTIQQATMQRAVGDLLDDARYVVIEVQSVGDNSDTFGLAHFAEAAIIAVEVGRSRPDDVADCAGRLTRLGARVLGTAVVPAGTSAAGSRQERRAESARPASYAPAPAPSRAPATPAGQPPDRSFADSIKHYEMPPRPAAGPGGAPRLFEASSVGGVKETAPMPRLTAGEREGYPNPPDPATGD